MQYFPLFIDTINLNVLLVGAGEVASRKLALLTRTEANIHVIAPQVNTEVQRYAETGRILLSVREVVHADIQNYDLVYLATANDSLNAELATLATARGIWVNAVDNPAFCRFITPSIVDRGRLVVAISTAGAAPVFARTVRSRLEASLPQSLKPLFDFVADRRIEVQDRLKSTAERRLFWERFFETNGDRFDSWTLERYHNAFNHLLSRGEILLIEDVVQVDLLPIAAMPLLQRLDWIYSQGALSEALAELVRRDASRGELPALSELSKAYEQGTRMLLVADIQKINQLKAHFPMAKHLRPGAI
ncbi:bifunctional precorrin-2 dehydrogenase/sirohydrochlorin ferrochelatase [Shewanella putrefaciens]|jgi:precorrin-2 dehydrogenase/sirohydrochlorin ferrochelatase|uniref:precorrin-2 dehydrogenase n=1 Tax=Shewanella putrefaciens TaxID=24 RepID=A0ABX8X8R6_SHEPU|nr:MULTISPECIES: bifunctional precorrin-2 dehydrogenase/sirohydrochlorin ferrochelatase [Shewanella]CAD6364185.1 Siroheme synthase [Shewanella hafniensis]ABM24367.1 siroheme synthase [Shewanella sp. W3-18-1]AVV86106.1 siroheme synthase siroheme synthase [Shewanella putrefaciens]MCA1898577.1 bifunctional precorrin-2 dehydrogenase/sirohydrochlorin ferrochelatase [Shewanella putrefaciens]MCK7631777.1 bifunctional precorrin-2 dehydrogenase/sirohydrochlorin ferrochelatase [Shewanella sp. JNE9-1]